MGDFFLSLVGNHPFTSLSIISFLNEVVLPHRSGFLICFFCNFVSNLLQHVVMCRLGTTVGFSSSYCNFY